MESNYVRIKTFTLETYPIILYPTNNKIKVPESGRASMSTNLLELEFAGELKKEFPSKIETYQKVIIDRFSYYPDITYIDKECNIFIDIEVDEPYSKLGKIIHFIGDIKDERRNRLFTSFGWYVIRFSESQIKRKPLECVEIIRLFVNYVREGTSKELLDRTIKEIEQPRWSQEVSSDLMRQDIRDHYEFSEETIVVNPKKIVDTYNTEEALIKFLLENYLDRYENSSDILFIPFSISNIMVNPPKNIHFVNTKCITLCSQVEINGVPVGGFTIFSNVVQYRVFKEISIDLFEAIIRIKEENLRFNVNYDNEQFLAFSGIILFGSYEEFRNKQLKWKEFSKDK